MQAPVYDRKKPDKYAEHLSQVDSRYQVVAQDDIYNQFGLLLIPKGTRISKKTVGLLGRHRLRKILEDQVSIENQLNAVEFLQDAESYLENNSLFFNQSDYQHYKNNFISFFNNKNIPDVVFQKLTVMKTLFPQNYQEAVFCSWEAGLLAFQLGYSDRRCQNAIIAGLSKDFGLLHIAPEMLDFSDGYSEQKLRALHSHPIIGSLITEEQKKWDIEVYQAIREHHERIDGSGYPTGRSADDLSLLGQIIAMVDIIYSLKVTESNWQKDYQKLVLAYLKVHAGAIHQQVIHGVYSLFSQPGAHQAEIKNSGQLIQRVIRAQRIVESLYEDLVSVQRQLMQWDAAQSESRFNRTALHIDSVINMTGINTGIILSWIKEAGDDKQALDKLASDLSDQDAMQYELFWLFRRLNWGIEDIYRQYGHQPDYLNELYNKVEQALSDCLPLYQ